MAHIKLACPDCGTDDVGREATAHWDIDTQAWVLGSVYDQGWCNNCGNRDLVEVELSDDDDTCSTCGKPLDDGQGYDGLCGDCADAEEDENAG